MPDNLQEMVQSQTLEGYLHAPNSHRLSGWAWDKTEPDQPIAVDIYVDGQFSRTVIADQLGADLLAAGIGNGRHRWSCDIAELIDDGNLHELSVRFGGTSLDLKDSPKKYLRGLLELLPDVALQAIASALYIRGRGIEIGALNNPLQVPAGSETQFVDRMSVTELRREYPEMNEFDLVPVDIIDDGETLSRVGDNSQDYVIANNFLEHCEDPIGALKNFFRVIRPGGVIFLLVPNKRANIDVDREVTSIDHIIRDHELGPNTSRKEHYEDWVRTIVKESDEKEIARKAEALARSQFSIHFHVFTEFETIELFCVMRRRYRIPFRIEHVANNACHETVIVARKEL